MSDEYKSEIVGFSPAKPFTPEELRAQREWLDALRGRGLRPAEYDPTDPEHLLARVETLLFGSICGANGGTEQERAAALQVIGESIEAVARRTVRSERFRFVPTANYSRARLEAYLDGQIELAALLAEPRPCFEEEKPPTPQVSRYEPEAD